jgi:hypothetical protein
MTQVRTWWRKLGGLMVVCLLAALVVGPALDSIICNGETDVAMATLGDDPAVASHTQDHSAPTHGSDGACVHGHCHHGLTVALAIADATTAPTTATQAHCLASASVLGSRNPSGLERPPRA